MKKILSCILSLLLLTALLAGCGGGKASSAGGTASKASSSSVSSAESGTSSAAGISGTDTSESQASTESPAAESSETSVPDPSSDAGKEAVTVLYTNDVHCGVDDNIGYAGLSAYKKKLEAEGKNVLLVDDGDAIQGAVFGMLTQGESIIQVMNAVGYDVATFGNHEFDYSVERLLELTKKAEFPYVCCNFKDVATGELLVDPYKIMEVGGWKIAFVGAATPDTLISSTPTFFRNEDGSFRYSFSQGGDGSEFYETVQKSVDDARSEGADICILVAHLGLDELSSPYMATELIANTNGIDVVLDGHSHSVVASDKVRNKDGNFVLYSQTGTKLANIGELTIRADGQMSTRLIGKDSEDGEEFTEKDEEITKLDAKIREEFAPILEEKIGHSNYDLCISDENGNRIVRNVETNLADLVADSMWETYKTDVALLHGGAVRADVSAGDITYENALAVMPFSCELIVVKATGQMIADALEVGAMAAPAESGGFLHVSGMTYTIDLSIPSGVVMDDDGMMTSIEGERRVKDITVNGEPLEADRVYTVVSTDYLLLENGNGNTAFKGAEVVEADHALDVVVFKHYLQETLGGEVPERYADRYGEGRIKVVDSSAS